MSGVGWMDGVVGGSRLDDDGDKLWDGSKC